MVYIFLANGFEECEALIPLDILRRADIPTQTVGINGKTVKGSHGIEVICDITVDEAEFSESIKAVILPGGMPGTLNLKENTKVCNITKAAAEKGVITAAICAAPMILGSLNLLKGKNAVCYPGFEAELKGATVSEKGVVCDGNIITAKGVGAAFDFGFEILTRLTNDADSTEKLKQTMIYRID